MVSTAVLGFLGFGVGVRGSGVRAQRSGGGGFGGISALSCRIRDCSIFRKVTMVSVLTNPSRMQKSRQRPLYHWDRFHLCSQWMSAVSFKSSVLRVIMRIYVKYSASLVPSPQAVSFII